MTISGDLMRADEPSIIIMNHRTRLDWMYFWCVLVRQPSGIMNEKIILKSTLKHYPGPGTCNTSVSRNIKGIYTLRNCVMRKILCGMTVRKVPDWLLEKTT